MQLKNYFLSLLCLITAGHLFSQQTITGIYTDFNGYWHSSSSSISNIRPNNSHNLLGFQIGNQIYSTGVEDAILTSQLGAGNYSPEKYQAFPVSSLPSPTSSSYIGVGALYGGGPGAQPMPSTSMEYYLTDGIQGLDIGTGVYNLPVGQESRYTVVSINASAIGDGKPDIIVAQMGDYSPNSPGDVFRFTDNDGNTIGTPKTIDFSTVNRVAQGEFKFFSISNGQLTLVPGLTGPRDLRLIAYDFADFGITSANISQIASLVHKLSGVSDQPFIAYNSQAIVLNQSISGSVKDEAGNAVGNVTVELYDNTNTLVTSVTTGPDGNYIFGDLPPQQYTVKLILPDGATLIAASDGGTDENIDVTVNDTPVTDISYVIHTLALPVTFDKISAQLSNGSLIVKWTTTSETNNDHFDIMISEDGKNFVKAGSVSTKAEKGNSSVELDYSFSKDDINSVSLAGISLLVFAGFLLGLSRKNKLMLSTIVLAGIGLCVISCSKHDDTTIDTTNKKIFVKIIQVDDNGKEYSSKVVEATQS